MHHETLKAVKEGNRYYQNCGEKTLTKDRRIIIRLYEHDYQGIQKKAIEMGIPYQTLISGIIHRYIEGDLTSKTG